ncbi:MAG TPA: glutathione transferase GstA [Candidatus Macondimonas sp.]|nr:glutathione transferase GstA [Candidatus Macondimonas sp.]
MKLFYSPGACSMAPHIALREAGLPFTLEKVDLRAKKTEHGTDFAAINPKGYVPALELDDGTLLTEAGVMLQYIADQAPASELAPAFGTMARYHLMETIHFIATELHKSAGALFNPAAPEEWRQVVLGLLGRRFGFIENRLGDRPYIEGGRFTVADAYLFTVLSWSRPLKIDLAPWPGLLAYLARIGNRPKVNETLRAEGLISAS